MKNKILFLVILLMLSVAMKAQTPSKDNKISDTTNKSDNQGNKYGYWIEKQGDATFKGEYLNNRKVKNWVGYYPNKIIYRIDYYTNGNKDGISIQFDRKGKVSLVENYKAGLLNGETVSYGQYNDFPLSDGEYKNGKKNGTFRKFADNGKIQEETNFKDDMKDGASKWYNKSGKLIAEYNYKNGKFEGPQKTYYENDSLQSLNFYTDDLLSGESKEYYRNGRVKVSGTHVMGLKEGTWTEYDEVGKIQAVIKYKNGIEQKKK